MQCKEPGCRNKAKDGHFICKKHFRLTMSSEKEAEEADEVEEAESNPLQKGDIQQKSGDINLVEIFLSVKAGKMPEVPVMLTVLQKFMMLMNLLGQIHSACKEKQKEHPLFQEILEATKGFGI